MCFVFAVCDIFGEYEQVHIYMCKATFVYFVAMLIQFERGRRKERQDKDGTAQTMHVVWCCFKS